MDTQGMENLINLYIKERDLATLGKCYQHLYHRAGSCSVGGLIQLHQSRNAARFESYRFITNGKESIALYSELYCRLCKIYFCLLICSLPKKKCKGTVGNWIII